MRLLAGLLLVTILLSSGHAEAKFGPYFGGAAGPLTGCIQGVTPPAQATTLGYTCLTFADGPFSLSRIDTAKTHAPGFNWYPMPDNGWPQAAIGEGWQSRPSYVPAGHPSTPADYSIDGSNNLFVQPSWNGPSWAVLSSCSSLPSPPYVGGNMFAGGMYLKFIAQWQPIDSPPDQDWPVVWSLGEPFFNGGNTGTFDFTELDYMESSAYPNADSLRVRTVVGGNQTHDYSVEPSFSPVSGIEIDYSLVPAALNGAHGGLDGYNQFIAGVYNQSWPPNSGYPSAYSLALAQPQCLLLEAGQHAALTMQRIEVWQAPPSISAVTLSGTTFTGGASSGTVVGTIGVTLAPNPNQSTAALSLGGTDAANFQLAGAGCADISLGSCSLETSGVVSSGSYSITLTATQSGLASYTPAPFTITGSGGASSWAHYSFTPEVTSGTPSLTYNLTGSAVPAGSCIIATIYPSANVTTTVAAGGETFTNLDAGSAWPSTATAVLTNATGGETTVTITTSASSTIAAFVEVFTWSGGACTTVRNHGKAANQTGASISSGSVTTVANDLVFGAVILQVGSSGNQFTLGSGFTGGTGIANDFLSAGAYSGTNSFWMVDEYTTATGTNTPATWGQSISGSTTDVFWITLEP